MDQRLETLKATLRLLAAPASEQAPYLDSLLGPKAADYGNDELALELDDLFSLHQEMLRAGSLTERQVAAVQLVNGLLATWSGPGAPEFWRREALSSDTRWDQVREAAEAALRSFD